MVFRDFLTVYDEDRLKIDGDIQMDVRLDLCSGLLIPCAITVEGKVGSRWKRQKDVISCNAAQGCTTVAIAFVNLVCDHPHASQSRPLQATGIGAVLTLTATKISDCLSEQDGGSIRLYENSVRVCVLVCVCVCVRSEEHTSELQSR